MISKIRSIFFIYFSLVLVACQSKPTKVIQESVNVFEQKSVLVDVRNSLDYSLYHIPGSVNLSSENFLILKDPKTKKRILDPDLSQLVERLAKRGLHPSLKVILVSDKRGDVELKKWNWLLKQLDFESVQILSLTEFKKEHGIQPFAEPKIQDIWILKSSVLLQNEFLLNKSKDCFVKWSDSKCKM